jgi:hypothetical protein
MTGDATTDVLMCGTAVTDLPLPATADALRRAGIAAQVRESSHYEGGAYVRVGAAPDVHCSLERLASAEYLVRGDADALDSLTGLARALSAALAVLGIRHRLELYVGDVLAAYFHHQWPPPADEI